MNQIHQCREQGEETMALSSQWLTGQTKTILGTSLSGQFLRYLRKRKYANFYRRV